MKIYMESDNGTRVEVKEIEGVAGDVLLMKVGRLLMERDMKRMEEELTEKTGKKVVLLHPFIESVYGV